MYKSVEFYGDGSYSTSKLLHMSRFVTIKKLLKQFTIGIIHHQCFIVTLMVLTADW